MPSTTTKLFLSAGLVALANAHAVMNVPQAYGFGSGLTNGPMTQAAFPCKKDEVQFTSSGNSTTWTGGQSQPLHLLSGATHGGGTCFIAMTYETPGSSAFEDAANWKAVYTLPGDCPATTPGNLETATTTDGYPTGPQCTAADSSETGCVHSFNVPMPDELKDGEATFGWVWLSRVTAETYMNCAPITISGAKNNGQYDSLPSLEGMSFTGLTGGGVPGASGSSTSSGSASASSGTSSTGSSGTSDGGSSAASAAPAAASPAASSSPFGTGSSGSDSGSAASAAPASAATSAPAAAAPPAASAGAAGTSGGACTSGAIQCNGSTWSMCSNGAWVDMGSVGGLTCSDNSLNKRVPYKTFNA